MYETIIWATDGSEGSDLALEEALRLAAVSAGRIVAVHCDQRLNGRASGWPVLADEDDLRLRIRRQVEELHEHGMDIELVVRRSHHEAADVVASVAAELGGDVIVCGTRGLGALSGAFHGSFTQRLQHDATCPVLAVNQREARKLEHEKTKAHA
jgi:nucleotide-binding universal stress UspA family protein